VNVEHFGFDAEYIRTTLHLSRANLGQRAARNAPVPDIAVRAVDKLDVMPLGRPHGRYAPGAKLVVVRMCAEADDPQFSICGIRGGRGLRQRAIQSPGQD